MAIKHTVINTPIKNNIAKQLDARLVRGVRMMFDHKCMYQLQFYI